MTEETQFTDKLLFTDTEDIDEWTVKWRSLRGRHPFFLCNEISSKTTRILELYKSVIPELGGVDVIIQSPGGDLKASFRAPYVFQSFCDDFVAVIPRFAKSGATLFSLGAPQIMMGRWAELGPLDPQVASSSSAERHYFNEAESALESFHALKYVQKEVTEYLDIFVAFLIGRGISPRTLC